MFDFIFDIVCGNEYHVMVLTIREGILYAVPCDDAMSGYYAVYDKQVKLSDMKVTEFMDLKIDNENIDAILFKKYKNELEIIPCFNSWDGFQPIR